jgi:hypothetical protein
MRFISLLAVVILLMLSAAGARAQDGGCCPHCGCNNVTKVCRIVPVVTKVPKVEYSCKCGDICVPGHSKCVGTECVTDCDGHTYHQKVYEPCCGKIFKTVTPQKTTTTVEKCGYKCVVEYTCGKCGCCRGGDQGDYTQGQPGGSPHAAEPANHGHPPNWHRSN